MENEPKKDYRWLLGILFIALLALIAWIFGWLKKPTEKPTPTKYYPKSDLVKLYKYDIRTINKWVAEFCDQNQLPYKVYKRKRKLPEDMYHYILESLGIPTPEMPVKTKFQIITQGEEMIGNEYRGVKNSICRDDNRVISPEAYAKLNVFPPKIAYLLSKKVA